VASVSFAHVTWCIDVALNLVAGRMIFGVSAYVFHPKRTWLEILGTLHHVWFLPVTLATLRHEHGMIGWLGGRARCFFFVLHFFCLFFAFFAY
jgi:hypothetical protein